MDSESERAQPEPHSLLSPRQLSDAREESSPRRPRRGRVGRFVGLSIVFLVGIVCGSLVTILYGLTISGTRGAISTPQAPKASALIVQVDRAYITRTVQHNLNTSGMLNASDVQVTLATGDQMTITGNDQALPVVTVPFRIVVQPVVFSCQLQVNIMQASVGIIGITQIATNFESQVNQQLQMSSSGLPPGFTYCKTSVRTDPNTLYITFSATPTS